MASRMERYYKQGNTRLKRSERNQELYRDIYDSASYSNIEGIATIEKSNEIDITKVKKMLKNREEYKRQKEVSRLIKKEPEVKVKTVQTLSLDNDKNYDIRDILDKAKVNKKSDDKYHSIDNTSYDILKKLKEKKELFKDEPDEDELRELIDTITGNTAINQLNDKELSLDLLDDLKSNNDDTVIKDNSAIKNILEEAKKEEMRKKEDTTTSELDKSFFTSSLNFGKDDFEKIASLTSNLKKNNVLLKLLVLVVLIAVTAGIIFLVYNFIK